MRLAALPLSLVVLSFAASAAAGDVRGRVRVLEGGKEKADAQGVLVYVTGFAEPPPSALPQLRQRGRQFQPPLLAITAGQSVSFPNGDPFFHNVFSLSPVRRFDLGQFKSGETKIKEFPKPGIVEVYCNIHPEMAATILVLPNRRFTTTARDGSFTLAGVPPGTWTLYAYDRLAEKPVKTEVTVPAAGSVTLEIEETRQPDVHKNKYGELYAGTPPQ